MSSVKKHTIVSSCYLLTMDKFIDCLVEDKLQVLGNGTQEQLNKAWGNIVHEFSELRADKSATELLELQKEIFVLQNKIKIISLCVGVLWDTYNRDLANELKTMGFNVKLNWSNKAQYYKELNLVISKSKTFDVLARRKEKELLELIKKSGTDRYQRKDFVSINTSLSKYMSFHVNNNQITVAEWCDMVNKYEEYIEIQQKQLNRNGRWI